MIIIIYSSDIWLEYIGRQGRYVCLIGRIRNNLVDAKGRKSGQGGDRLPGQMRTSASRAAHLQFRRVDAFSS